MNILSNNRDRWRVPHSGDLCMTQARNILKGRMRELGEKMVKTWCPVLLCCAIGMVCGQVPGAERRESVLFVGAHPDDTEGFAATAFLLRDKYDIHIVDFTGGERGCGEAKYLNGWTKEKRRKEEESACSFLGAKHYWIGEVDGEACATSRTVALLLRLIAELKPRAVFTHWPVDGHPDHMQCATATQIAVLRINPRPEFYFFEVIPGETANWHPLYSVDVTATMDKKTKMMRLYECQNVNDWLVKDKIKQAEQRGREREPACRYAETFTTYDGQPIAGGILEGLAETVKVTR